MILLTSFGLLMMVLSMWMIKNPHAFADALISFSQQAYFHAFEILTRLLFGVIFVYYSPLTLAPNINAIFGYAMLLSTAVLLGIGANKHRSFALWSAQRFRSTFRFFGLFSFVFGAYIIYTTLFTIL